MLLSGTMRLGLPLKLRQQEGTTRALRQARAGVSLKDGSTPRTFRLIKAVEGRSKNKDSLDPVLPFVKNDNAPLPRSQHGGG